MVLRRGGVEALRGECCGGKKVVVEVWLGGSNLRAAQEHLSDIESNPKPMAVDS